MEREQPETIEEIYQTYFKKIRKMGCIVLCVNLVAIALAILSFFV